MKLSTAENLLLEALRAAIRDEPAVWTAAVPSGDRAELIRLAAEQSVFPLVIEACYESLKAQDADMAAGCKELTKRQVIGQVLKTQDFLALYDAMTAAGFHPLVVKGLLCRSLYPRGDHRPSTDEDLLVPEDEWEALNVFVRAQGFAPLASDELSQYEIGWVKGALYLELHRSLFPSDSAATEELNRAFAGCHARRVWMDVGEGRRVLSLSAYDHFLFLILHAYKHFIHCGFGLRQASDVGLWAKRYGKDIDWDRLYEQCAAMHTLRFAAAVLVLARDVLGVELVLPQRWEALKVDTDPLLRDMLDGGVYGASDMSRLHSSTVTLHAVAAERKSEKAGKEKAAETGADRKEKAPKTGAEKADKAGEAGTERTAKAVKERTAKAGKDAGRLKAAGAGFVRKLEKAVPLRTVFPARSSLERQYPELKEHPARLPIVWGKRMLRYMKETRGAKGNSAAESLKIARDRTKLLKYYDIIE